MPTLLSHALLLLFFATTANADPYNCTGNHTIPFDIGSATFTYPPAGQDTHFGKNMVCGWNMLIPTGYIMHISLSGDLSHPAVDFQTSDYVSVYSTYREAFGFAGDISSQPHEFDILPTSAFIQLVTSRGSVGTFSFTTTIMKQRQPTGNVVVDLKDGYAFRSIADIDQNKSITFTSNLAQLSLIPFDESDEIAMSFIVYDGPSVDSPVIGPLSASRYAVWDKLYSSGGSLTINNPYPDENAKYGGFFVADKKIVEQFTCIEVVNYKTPDITEFACNGTNAVVYAVPDSNALAVTSILDFHTFNYSVPAYSGFPYPDAQPLQTFVPQPDFTPQFPQLMPNGVFTLTALVTSVMDDTQVNVYYDDGNVKFSDSRIGYLYTQNYGHADQPQFLNANFTTTAPGKYSNYTLTYNAAGNFNVDDVISISSEFATISINNASRSGVIVGTTFNAQFDSNGTASGGMQMSYDIRPVGEALTTTTVPTTSVVPSSTAAQTTTSGSATGTSAASQAPSSAGSSPSTQPTSVTKTTPIATVTTSTASSTNYFALFLLTASFYLLLKKSN